MGIKEQMRFYRKRFGRCCRSMSAGRRYMCPRVRRVGNNGVDTGNRAWSFQKEDFYANESHQAVCLV